jgi:hypothetical protein
LRRLKALGGLVKSMRYIFSDDFLVLANGFGDLIANFDHPQR